ncbi:lipopolysaccharide biosynthesis protein [Rheinheimera sp. NSM]|uniref:lipopolysaccharide biosynthesis protein n=1 Tax=Rheinheimera sp. NSM TaxID=3457884 RepID=UPI0040352E32
MLKRFKKLAQGSLFRNILTVATGTAGAQAITMLASPFITRLYGPEAFGVLGAFLALVMVLSPIAALCYPIAIVLPRQDSEAKKIAQLSALLALTLAFVITLLLLVAGETIVHWLGLEAIYAFVLFIPLAMFFSALHQILQQWLIRKKQFKVTAKVAFMQSAIVNTAKVGIGWFNPVAAVLIVIATLAHALHAVMLFVGAKATLASQAVDDNSNAGIWALAKKYYDFPLFRAPQALINAVSLSLPVLMLMSFFGPAAAGFYALAKTILAMPANLLGKAVADVFYPRITEAANNGENVAALLRKATWALAGVGVLPFALIVVAGPWLFGFVFGAEWTVSGEYARWMALWLYAGFLNRPSVAAIATLSLQGFFLCYEIVSVLLRAAALVAGFMLFNSDVIAVMLFSLVSVALNVLLIAFTFIKAAAVEQRTR